jgi:hypothetical protein
MSGPPNGESTGFAARADIVKSRVIGNNNHLAG